MIDIIIVGAGIGGSALALGLCEKYGCYYRVHLVERRKYSNQRRGGTYLMQPNSIRALKELCPAVWQDLDPHGIPIPTSGGKMYVWGCVRDALWRHVEKHENIVLYNGWTFEELREEETFVEAKFIRTKGSNARNPDSGNREEDDDRLILKGSLLVGADGVHSAVRTALGLPPAEKSEASFWRGTIKVPEDHEILGPLLEKGLCPLGYLRYGSAVLGIFNYHSYNPGVMTWSVNSKDSSVRDPRHILTYGFEQAEIFRAALNLANPDDVLHRFRVETIDPEGHADGWGGRGRVTLLGDAAHAMRPAGGLGGSMALEDCVVLTRCLTDASSHDELSLQSLTRQFEKSRLPRVKRVWQDQKERAERAYQKGVSFDPNADKEFYQWVYQGV